MKVGPREMVLTADVTAVSMITVIQYRQIHPNLYTYLHTYVRTYVHMSARNGLGLG